MGWGRMFLLGNIGQQMDIQDQQAEIENLKSELRESRSSSPDLSGPMARLQAENDELRLYLAATIRLLISKGVISREEMQQVVDVVDAEDGSRDGRFKGNLG